MTGYAELHCHSAYSFLDGASTPAELAATAAELGYRALALTDHDNVCGAMEFAHACKGVGLQAIVGAEVTVEGDSHVTLLVEDQDGWHGLCRLLSEAHEGTRDGPREPDPSSVPLDSLEREARRGGLVCLSGCARQGAVAGQWGETTVDGWSGGPARRVKGG